MAYNDPPTYAIQLPNGKVVQRDLATGEFVRVPGLESKTVGPDLVPGGFSEKSASRK